MELIHWYINTYEINVIGQEKKTIYTLSGNIKQKPYPFVQENLKIAQAQQSSSKTERFLINNKIIIDMKDLDSFFKEPQRLQKIKSILEIKSN